MSEERIVVRRNPAEHRFEILDDGELAGISVYREEGERTVFLHTVVLPSFEGRGLGSRLAKSALDEVVAGGGTIVPVCPFIASYLERHPEYAGSVAAPTAAASAEEG